MTSPTNSYTEFTKKGLHHVYRAEHKDVETTLCMIQTQKA